MSEMEPTEIGESSEPESPAGDPSALLMAAREKLGLSQKEVADKLFLTTSFIKYIDEGRFESIPKPAFVKGYLRSYARSVDLSGDEIVALYEAQVEAAEPAPEIRGVTEESVGSSSITGPVLQTGMIGLVGLVVVVGFIWWLVSEPEEPVPVVTTSAVVGPSLDEQSETGSDAFAFIDQTDENSEPVAQLEFTEGETEVISSTQASEELAKGGQSLESADADRADNNVSDEADQIETSDEAGDSDQVQEEPQATEGDSEAADSAEVSSLSEVIVERIREGDRNYITVNAGGFDQIDLSFSDECWVEIEDNGIGLIYNDLNRAGDVLTVYSTAPVQLLLGKATAVEMIYNGRPFDLGPFTSQDETAKLTISE